MIFKIVPSIFVINFAVFFICDGRPWIDDEKYAVEESGNFELQPRVIDDFSYLIDFSLSL